MPNEYEITVMSKNEKPKFRMSIVSTTPEIDSEVKKLHGTQPDGQPHNWVTETVEVKLRQTSKQ